MNKRVVPFSSPDITDSDVKSVELSIKSGWLAHGDYSKKFEELFAKFTGSPYSATVSNCTTGLHLSCMAAGFGKEDEVIVPAQTHTATAHAVEFTGAKAVFVDVDEISGNMLVSELRKKISNKTKGVIPVHMAGFACEIYEIKKLCKENNLILIEDCAHAIGTQFNDVHVGNYGITGCFSFYPTKQITTGEGGMVISNDKNIIENIKKLKAFGIDTPPELRKKPGFYDVQGLGNNYRMTDFQAALGVGQIERYDKNLARRKDNAKLYCDLLKGITGISFLDYSEHSSYFLFQIILENHINRDEILLKLKEMGIGVSIHYATPVPLMSYYRNKYGYKTSDFPNALNFGNQSISLPVHSNLVNDDIAYICEVLGNYLGKKNE